MNIALLLATALLVLHGDGLRVRAPAEVGMSPERLEYIDRIVRRGITAGGYPGAAVIIGRRSSVVYEQAFGKLSWSATSSAVSTDESIYDLASLTKVVGTTTAAMVLFDEGKLRLDAPVSTYVPGFSGGLKDLVTVRMLLLHQSGLPAGRELWRKHLSHDSAKQLVISTKLQYKPGAGTVYSDLGADMLGWVVESAAESHSTDSSTTASSSRSACATRASRPLTRFDTASPQPKSGRLGVTHCAAKCTTKTPSRSAASSGTRASLDPPATLRSSPR